MPGDGRALSIETYVDRHEFRLTTELEVWTIWCYPATQICTHKKVPRQHQELLFHTRSLLTP
jgi:hypothetical protein